MTERRSAVGRSQNSRKLTGHQSGETACCAHLLQVDVRKQDRLCGGRVMRAHVRMGRRQNHLPLS